MPEKKVVVTDFIEPDLEWEKKQFKKLGVDFSINQLKFAEPEELLGAAAEADVLIVNMAKIDDRVLNGLKNCKLIIRHGVGYDNVDVEAATKCGIMVSRVPDYCINEVAEQTVLLIMASQRKLTEQLKIMKTSVSTGRWLFDPIHPIHSLHGKTLGIVGCGRIGSMVKQMMAGLGVNHLIYDPYLSEERKCEIESELVSLDRLLEKSDIVSIHCPLNQETYHLLSTREFKLMKQTSILVNTARGGIVDLKALDKALKEGELAFAAIDVYEKEPPEPELALLKNERAICTPHLAWLSVEAEFLIREKIVEDVHRFLKGERPRFPINGENINGSWPN